VVFVLYFRFIIMKGEGDQDEVLIPRGRKYIAVTILVAICVFTFLGWNYLLKVYPFSFLHDSSSYVKIVAEMKKVGEEKYKFNGSLDPNFRAQ
jgi:hypothetical protein